MHIGGIITDEILEIKKFCKEKNIYLIEDAAHAHGSTFNKMQIREFGIAAVFMYAQQKLLHLEKVVWCLQIIMKYLKNVRL